MDKIKNIIDSIKLGKTKKKIIILLLSIPVPLLLSFAAYLLNAKTTTIISISSIGILLIFVPFLAINFIEFKEILDAEKNYPAFLRDLAQSVSSGMTIPQAIDVVSETNYGKLSKYIKKLDIYLSWNIPFPEAWEKFTHLLEKSSLMTRINDIILEAFKTGGDLKTTLNSLSNDVIILKNLESEKKTAMYEQIIIMYVVFFIFLGVIVSLFKILSPILFIQKMGIFSKVSLTQTTGESIGINYFKNLFFMMALIEGICAGFISGQISEERLIAGFKHVIVMVASTLLVFFILIFPANLVIDASIYPILIEPGQSIVITGSARFEADALIGQDIDVILPDGTITRELTDSNGQFTLRINAPEVRGTYNIIASTTYNKESSQVEIIMRVT